MCLCISQNTILYFLFWGLSSFLSCPGCALQEVSICTDSTQSERTDVGQSHQYINCKSNLLVQTDTLGDGRIGGLENSAYFAQVWWFLKRVWREFELSSWHTCNRCQAWENARKKRRKTLRCQVQENAEIQVTIGFVTLSTEMLHVSVYEVSAIWKEIFQPEFLPSWFKPQIYLYYVNFFNRSLKRTADSLINFVREKLSWKITKKRIYSRRTLMSLMRQGERQKKL